MLAIVWNLLVFHSQVLNFELINNISNMFVSVLATEWSLLVFQFNISNMFVSVLATEWSLLVFQLNISNMFVSFQIHDRVNSIHMVLVITFTSNLTTVLATSWNWHLITSLTHYVS